MKNKNKSRNNSKDKNYVENFFHLKYKLPFLNSKELDELIKLRKKKFPKYESYSYFKRIEMISDLELKYAITMGEIKDVNTEIGNSISKIKLDIVDLIILKEIQKAIINY